MYKYDYALVRHYMFIYLCRNARALEMCSWQVCKYVEGCQCPLTIPNEHSVQDNPMTVMVTGNGRIDATFIGYLEKALEGIGSLLECPPSVSLFFDVMSMSDSELRKAITTAKKGRLVYDFGIYGKANVDTVEEWKKVASTSRNRLQEGLRSVKLKSEVGVFRAANFEWTDNMFSALDELGIRSDFSYVTRQPLWPFTLAYQSRLCFDKMKDVPLESLGYTYLCPGRFKKIWVIPNNALFTKSESRQNNCTWLSECLSSASSANQSLEDLLTVNYQLRSTSKGKLNNYWQSREPFVINLRAEFFQNFTGGEENGIATLNRALKAAVSSPVHSDDRANEAVYFVHVSQLIDWMATQPTNKEITNGFYEGELFTCKTKYNLNSCESAFVYIPGALMMLQVLIYFISLVIVICKYDKDENLDLHDESLLTTVRNGIAKVIGRKCVTCFGSLLTATCFDGYCLGKVCGWPKSFPRQELQPTNYDTVTLQPTSREKSGSRLCKLLIIPGWFVFRGIALAGMLAGPIRLWIDGAHTPGYWETKQGFAFRYVLGAQTATVCLYWPLSVFVSLRIRQGRKTLKDLEVDYCNLRRIYKSSWGSYVGCCLVTLTYIGNAISMSYSYSKRESMGWYSTFNCDTALMYLSFYSTLFLMGHMSLLFAFSFDQWCESYLHLLEKFKKDEDETARSTLKKFQKAYKEYYTGYYKSLFYLVVVQMPAGYLPMYWFAQYIQKTFEHMDLTGKVLRISLLVSLLIIDMVPYVTTWITHKWVKSRHKEITEDKPSSNGHGESDEGCQEEKEDLRPPNPDEFLNKGQFLMTLVPKITQVITFLSWYN